MLPDLLVVPVELLLCFITHGVAAYAAWQLQQSLFHSHHMPLSMQ